MHVRSLTSNRGRSGYSRYGKRSPSEGGEIPEEAIELMFRAAEMDEDEQCVRRLICEVSANTVDDKETNNVSAAEYFVTLTTI